MWNDIQKGEENEKTRDVAAVLLERSVFSFFLSNIYICVLLFENTVTIRQWYLNGVK